MVCCAVARCKNSSAKAKKCRDGITFHRFPQDAKRRKLWEIAVDREANWVSTDSSAVCSDHFEVKEFYYTESGLRRLSAAATPKINISRCQDYTRTVTDMNGVHIKPTDTKEVIQLKHKVRRLCILAANRRKKIKMMQEARKRTLKQLNTMMWMIGRLVGNNSSSSLFHPLKLPLPTAGHRPPS